MHWKRLTNSHSSGAADLHFSDFQYHPVARALHVQYLPANHHTIDITIRSNDNLSNA